MTSTISLCDLPWWAVVLSWLLPALLGYFWGMLTWSRYKAKSKKADQDLNSASRRIVNLENEVNECRKSYDEVNKEKEKLLLDRTTTVVIPGFSSKASTPESSSPNISEIIHETKSVFGYAIKRNDLKIIDQIDPKIEKLLIDQGITDWHKMESADVEVLKSILKSAGYSNLNPQSWPYQSSLARQEKWDELKTFQSSKG